MRQIRILKELPTVLIDPTLTRSVSENRKGTKSHVGSLYGVETPVDTETPVLQTPIFLDDEKPEDYDTLVAKGKVDEATDLQELLKTPLLLRKQADIERFIRSAYHQMQIPAAYVGGELGTDHPSEYDTADLRVLVCRLSAYDAVAASMTHGALRQMVKQAGREANFTTYVDYAFLPCGNPDIAVFREHAAPWWFGRNTKRHARDFDLVLVGSPLTLEINNFHMALHHSGIPIFSTQRKDHLPLGSYEEGYPPILIGGMPSDFSGEPLGGGMHIRNPETGENEWHESIPDAIGIGDGEHPVPKLTKLAHLVKQTGGTKRDFIKACHSLADDADFERNSDAGKPKWNWFYEPRAYEAIYEKDETTGREELKEVVRRPEYPHATLPGYLKRSIMRDLNQTQVWTQSPVHWAGSMGSSADIQLSSGCITGDTLLYARTTAADGQQRTGYLRAEDLFASSSLQKRRIEIWAGQGLTPARGLVVRPARPTVKITTDSGATLHVTTNHTLLRDCKPVLYQRAAAIDLRPGDQIWCAGHPIGQLLDNGAHQLEARNCDTFEGLRVIAHDLNHPNHLLASHTLEHLIQSEHAIRRFWLEDNLDAQEEHLYNTIEHLQPQVTRLIGTRTLTSVKDDAVEAAKLLLCAGISTELREGMTTISIEAADHRSQLRASKANIFLGASTTIRLLYPIDLDPGRTNNPYTVILQHLQRDTTADPHDTFLLNRLLSALLNGWHIETILAITPAGEHVTYDPVDVALNHARPSTRQLTPLLV